MMLPTQFLTESTVLSFRDSDHFFLFGDQHQTSGLNFQKQIFQFIGKTTPQHDAANTVFASDYCGEKASFYLIWSDWPWTVRADY